MPLAPRLESTRKGVSRTGKNVSTSRTGIEEATTSVVSGASSVPSSAATRGSLRPAGPTVSAIARAAARSAACQASSHFVSLRFGSCAARRAWCAGRRSTIVATLPAGVLPGVLRVEGDLQGVELRQPRPQRLRGRQVADSQHQLRDVRPARRRAAARRSGRSRPGRGGRRRAARPAAGSRRARRTRRRRRRAAGRARPGRRR